MSFVSLFGDTFGEQGDTVRTKQRAGFRGEHDDVLDFVTNMVTKQIGALDYVTNMATQSEQMSVLDFVTSMATQSQQIGVLDFMTNTATQSEQIGVFAFVTNMATYSKPPGRWEFDVPFRDTHGKRARHANLQTLTDLSTNIATQSEPTSM